MQRVLEPELMLEQAQAEAYLHADFEEPHSRVLKLFEATFPGIELEGDVLDLGCGPGDITFRFARRFPRARLVGIDGARAMLKLGLDRLDREPEYRERVQFVEGYFPGAKLPAETYPVLIGNSLLHHVHDVRPFWRGVRRHAAPGAILFLVDLRRPADEAEARRLTDLYVANEPEVLRRDFYNSLRAAFEPGEVEAQLKEAGLAGIRVSVISDRHLMIAGRIVDR